MSALDLGPHQAERPLDAGLAGRRQRKQIVAADADGLGAERQRLQHMRSALDAAVHHHVDPIADRIDDLGELIEWRARAVELPAAVIGQHDAGAADLGGALRVLHRHHALEAELAVPMPHHLRHVVPVHRRIEHLGEVAADRHRAAAHVDVLVELRQPEAFVREVVDAPHRLDRELRACRRASAGTEWRSRCAGRARGCRR